MKGRVKNIIIASFFATMLVFITGGGALAEYHHVDGCTVCHDMYGGGDCGDYTNLRLIYCDLSTPNSGIKTVKFTCNFSQESPCDPEGTNSYADGDAIYDGVCEVCHTNTRHHRNDGNNPDPDPHYAGEDCITCHSHSDEFSHGGGAGTGCESCHGHDAGYEYEAGQFSEGAGTYKSHSTHTENDADDLKGPNIACGACHDTNNFPYFLSGIDGNSDGKYELSETDVCDSCHSPGGAFDGVAMAKTNWEMGIYETDGTTLKYGNEKWCATCHDDEPAYSQPCDPEGGSEAVEIVMDNEDATYAGTWPLITGNACAYQENFQWNEAGSGADTATWTPYVPVTDYYKVYVRWVAHANRATDAPYTINYDGGSETIDVDCTTAGCQWNLLGTYPFAAGTSGSIVLSDDANGYLNADAIKLTLVNPADIVMDNGEATYVGTWPVVTGKACAYQENFQWNEAGSGADTATWTPYIYEAGDYRVYARWVSHANRATDAPYTINYDGGSETIDVDCTTAGCQWNLLGTYPFAAGTSGSIVLSDDANGYLNADAIRLVSFASCADGVHAPNVIGDNTDYGFYVTGHKISCLSCHDARKNHIDHQLRTYASASNNYQAGYRLRSVGAMQPMKIPRPKTGGDPHNYLSHFALCFDCHNAKELLGKSNQWDASKTNFHYNSGANGHYNHLSMSKTTFDSDFDGVGDSDFTCTTCHNVHGSPKPAMTRHGELILATRDDLPPDFGALNFGYVTSASYPKVDPNATVVESIAGKMVLAGSGVLQNGICGATCHGSGATVYRTAYYAPRVLSCPKIDRVFNDGVDTALLTAYVLDHNAVTVPSVTIDVDPIDGSSATETMYDDGINGGDETGGDHIYTFETTVPDTVDAGPTGLDVTATDGDGVGTNQVKVLVVDPEEVVLDNADAEFVGTWPLITGSACAYQGDAQWNEAGSGADTATWIPDVAIPGLYEVYARWVANANRATDAPYTINYDGGSETVDVDCTIYGCQWNLLGTYPFAAGTSGSIVLSDDANGYLNADAIKLTLVDPSNIILDNSDATYVGTWPVVTGNACAYQENFQWNEAGSGADTATWTPYVPVTDDYKVYVRWVAHANRATDAPYTINYDGGSETVDVDCTIYGCQWNLLGTYPFAAGTSGSIVLSDDANGYLNADAIKLEVQP